MERTGQETVLQPRTLPWCLATGRVPGSAALGTVALGIVVPGIVAPEIVAPGIVAPGIVAPRIVAPGIVAPAPGLVAGLVAAIAEILVEAAPVFELEL